MRLHSARHQASHGTAPMIKVSRCHYTVINRHEFMVSSDISGIELPGHARKAQQRWLQVHACCGRDYHDPRASIQVFGLTNRDGSKMLSPATEIEATAHSKAEIRCRLRCRHRTAQKAQCLFPCFRYSPPTQRCHRVDRNSLHTKYM